MRVKMVPAILTSPAKLDRRKGATADASSDDDDDDVRLGEDSDPAIKSVATPDFDHSYVVDSDGYDSLSSSENSLEDWLTTTPDTRTGKAKNSSSDDDIDAEDTAHNTSASGCTLENAVFEGLPRQIDTSVKETDIGKQKTNSVQQKEDVLGKDEGSNHTNIVDDRSRLLAAAQAASIPSDDSFSDDTGERSRLMAAAQAASIPSDDSFSDESERSKLMAAAQAASIPSDDSFNDDREDAPMQASSISVEVSTRVVPTVDARVLQGSEDLESDEASSFSTLESDSEISSSDDESQISKKVLSNTTGVSFRATDYSSRISSRNSAEAGEDNVDDGSGGSEQSDHSGGNYTKMPKKKDLNSASFSGISTSFKWSNVKTKIFYSFRALKASVGSSSDGSRTISVRNLAREVTDDRLHDFFQDSGSILDIRIIRDAHSGLSSAYVEFESGNAARKAVHKSGKKFEGRVIFCDIAYENSKGSRSVPGSGHGVRRRSELIESVPASSNTRVLENQSALKLFDPELREGDAKFLSRFSKQFNISSYSDVQSSTSNPESVSSPLRLTGGQHVERSQGLVVAPWPDLYEHSNLIFGKSQAQLDQSVYFDAQNLERQESSILKRKKPWQWRPRKRKFLRFFWPWKRPRWQWWQLVKHSSTFRARRKTSRANQPKAIDKKQKTSEESVTLWCSH